MGSFEFICWILRATFPTAWNVYSYNCLKRVYSAAMVGLCTQCSHILVHLQRAYKRFERIINHIVLEDFLANFDSWQRCMQIYDGALVVSTK